MRWQLLPWSISIGTHALVLPFVLAATIFVWVDPPHVPPIAMLLSPAPPPPPPPPPPPAPARAPLPQAPVVATDSLEPRSDAPVFPISNVAFASPFGVPGGLGVPGGVIGGIPNPLPAPPPAPPPPAPDVHPIRVGAEVAAPALLQRVLPHYPERAQRMKLQGRVIVEADVGIDGRVSGARVQYSSADIFDEAALEAVRGWVYAPLRVDGRPYPFVLSVSIQFNAP